MNGTGAPPDVLCRCVSEIAKRDNAPSVRRSYEISRF